MNHPDHEIEMARSELYSIAKYAMALHEMLENVSELEGMEGWQQSKITKAADYMESVYQSLSHEMKFDEAAPKGWEGTVKAMKKHKEIDNPWALAHYMKNKGFKSHKEEEGVAEGSRDRRDPYDRGYHDGQRMGSNSYHNPYSREDEPTEWDEYKSGFNMAQIELQNDLEDNNFSEGEAGYGRNKGYAPGFASPTAPDLRPVGGPKQSDEPDAVNNIEVSINGRPWKVFAGVGTDSSQAFFKQKQSVDDMCKRKTAETGKKWSWGVTGAPATNENVEENKKGVRAVKHTTKPRNPVMAGDKPGKATVTHKNKKKDAERGIEKHKGKEPAYESRLWNALSNHLEK